MKIFLSSLALFFSLLISAQSEKGVSPILNQQSTISNHNTYAVVVGISDYQEPLIPDLKYADRDAVAFAKWLRSPAGGCVPEENIFLHTNEAATNAQIIMSLDWLIEESKEGDRAFIYFSGHGDVERVTKFNNGYLLGYDSPPAVYGAGAFAVNYLKDIIATLSDNGVQVFLISDACRAGKLAGSTTNGAQVTATRLSQQFANEIKILSCQPDEFSIEGEQWGGGRGCFSYHLENALYGFADRNNDAEINLMELGRYLEDIVSEEAAPESQFPMVEGPAKEKIASVDELAFAHKKEELKNKKTEFLAIDNKGLEDIILANADTNVQIIYEQFLIAIDSNYLMSPEGKSANDYYDLLMANKDIKKLHGTVKRKFVVALMDEGQQIVNKIMATDRQMMKDLTNHGMNYGHIADYYKKGAEILGTDHFAYNNIKSKELFFRSNAYKIDDYGNQSQVEKVAIESKKLLLEAIKLDSTNAIYYHSLVGFYPHGSEGRITNFTKAVDMAPSWAMGCYQTAYEYFVGRKDIHNTIKYCKQAIIADSNYLAPYNLMSKSYSQIVKHDSSAFWDSLYLEKFYKKFKVRPEEITHAEFKGAASTLTRMQKYDAAIEVLHIALEEFPNNISLLIQLGSTYEKSLNFEKAEELYMYATEVDSITTLGYLKLSYLYSVKQKNNEKAIDVLSQALEKFPDDLNLIKQLSGLYVMSNDYKKAVDLLTKALSFNLTSGLANNEGKASIWKQLGHIHFIKENYDQAEKAFKEACLVNPEDLTCNDYLSSIALQKNDPISAEKYAKKSIEINPSYGTGHYVLACAESRLKKTDEAFFYLEKAIEFGYKKHFNHIQTDPDLEFIRSQTKKWNTLMKKHFPEQYKD